MSTDPTPNSDSKTASVKTTGAAAASKPKKAKALVLAKDLIHRSRIHKAGAEAPSDLTEQQVERLKRLGVIET